MNQLSIYEYGKDAQPKLGMQIIVLFSEMGTITSDIICYGKDDYKLALGDKWMYYHELSHIVDAEVFPFNTQSLQEAAIANKVIEPYMRTDGIWMEYRGKFYNQKGEPYV